MVFLKKRYRYTDVDMIIELGLVFIGIVFFLFLLNLAKLDGSWTSKSFQFFGD